MGQAKKTPIDVIICTVHENEPYFARLKEFYPNAKFIRQVGNQLDLGTNDDLYPNLLASANKPYVFFKKHKVLYRQEFDMNLFKYRSIYNFNNIYSFQNDLEEDEGAWDMWIQLRHLLPRFNFKSFGVGNHDGKIFSKREYIKKMQDATFIFQRKFAEGYGHVVHNAFALGRPMILNKETYMEGIAKPLLKDNINCIFIRDTVEDTAKQIQAFSNNLNWIANMGKDAYESFKLDVDFDREFIRVKEFFDNLI